MTAMALAVDHCASEILEISAEALARYDGAVRQRSALSVVISYRHGTPFATISPCGSTVRQWQKKAAGNLAPAGFISNSKCYFSASTPASETTSS